MAEASYKLDNQFVRPLERDSSTVRLDSIEDAFRVVRTRSHTLEEIGLRQQAAALMTEVNSDRIQKAFLDIHFGTGLNASGAGWLPSIGVTGIPITPILTFELKPEELMELQVRQGKGKTRYYEHYKTKLEADLALEMYRQAASWESAHYSVTVIEKRLLPKLREGLAAAKRATAAGDPAGKVAAARHALDKALRRLHEARRMSAQSRATLNYLLGRPPEAAVTFLQRRHLRAPRDFWIHMRLVHAARKTKNVDLALQHWTAAVALRPEQLGMPR